MIPTAQLTDLMKIAPPPTAPDHAGAAKQWEGVERILDMTLPGDFKALINCYGVGSFCKFLYPLSPFAPFLTDLNLLSGCTKQVLSSYAAGRDEFRRYSAPFAIYPEPNGLFPWAITVNGDTVFWLRKGSPEEWSTVICDSKFSEEYDQFDLTAVRFLISWMSYKITPKVFPTNSASNPSFTPFHRPSK